MLLNKPQIGTHNDIERGEGQKILGGKDLKQLKKISKTPGEKQKQRLKTERDEKTLKSPFVPRIKSIRNGLFRILTFCKTSIKIIKK